MFRGCFGLAFCALASCAASTAFAGEKPIQIGASISLTTDFALAGVQQKGGIEYAIQKANEAGGVPGKGEDRKIEVTYGDNAMSPTTAVNALNRVLSENPVAVMLSIRGTHVLPQLPLLAKAKIAGISISGVSKLTKMKNPYLFRYFSHDGMTKRPLVKFVVEKLAKKRVGIFYSAEDFGTSGRDEIIKTLKELGMEPVAVEVHQLTDKDFSAQLNAFKEANADIIVLQTFQAPSALILKQARQLALDIPFALSSQSVAGSALKLVEAADVEGFYAETPLVDPVFVQVPAVQAWVKDFEKRIGFVPDFQAMLDYDATRMLLKSIELSGTDPAAIVATLGKIKFDGLGATYQADDDGDMLHSLSIVQIRNLQQIEIERVEVPYKPRG